MVSMFVLRSKMTNHAYRYTQYWEVIVVHAKVGIGYHGVASSIPPSDLPTLSEVYKGKDNNFHQALTRDCMYENSHEAIHVLSRRRKVVLNQQ